MIGFFGFVRLPWESLRARLQVWWSRRQAAAEREHARSWPLVGDVWVGHGERVQVTRICHRVAGQNGVDIMVTKGEPVPGQEVVYLWVPYTDLQTSTAGMLLLRRGVSS